MPGGFSLVITQGSEVGKKFSFDQDTVRMGRNAKENDIILNDISISSRHANITCKSGNYFLQDLGSTNKTYYRATPLTEGKKVQLQNGDEFSLGKVALRFNEKSCETGGSGTEAISQQTQDLKAKKGSKPSDNVLGDVLKKKSVWVVAVALVLLFLLMLIIKSNQTSKVKKAEIEKYPDYSSQPISLPAAKVYGDCGPDRTHPDKAIFTFTAKSGTAELSYTVGGIDSDGEVIILLNGTTLGNVPLAMKGWGSEQKISLPREYLKEGAENQLVFDNTMNPPGKEQWGVKNLKLEFLATGTCDVAEGNRLFELGNQLYVEKAVSEGNVYRAYNYYAKAVAQVQGCVPKPVILSEIESKMQSARTELDNRYNNLVFSYKKALKLKKYSQAKSELERIMLLIPDEKDERHKEVVLLLKKINKYLRRISR